MVTDEPLLALDNVSLCTSAGIAGRGFCAVRLLDRVSLTIHSGQLLLLRGGFENGSAALLGVIAGDDRVARRMTGDRHAAPGLIVRNGSVPADVIPALVHSWTSPGAAPFGVSRMVIAEPRPASTPLYLLRASRQSVRDDLEIPGWLQWCSQVKGRGGAIVVAERHNALREEEQFSLNVGLPSTSRIDKPYARFERRSPSVNGAGPARVNEHRSPCNCLRPIVRILQFGFGRLFHEDAHGQRQCRSCRIRGQVN